MGLAKTRSARRTHPSLIPSLILALSCLVPSAQASNVPFDDPVVIDASLAAASAVTSADLNRDGRLDVLAAGKTDGVLTAYVSTSDDGTSFNTSIIASDLPCPLAIVAADLNQDGNIDALSASGSNGEVIYYANDGSGTTWTPVTIEPVLLNRSTIAVTGVAVADLDQDGDPDVVSIVNDTNTVAWHENLNGDGTTWMRHVLSSTVQQPQAVAVADLNGDGLPDIQVTAHSNNTVHWLENQGGGSFTLRTISSSVSGVHGITTGDLDCDGDFDVVTTAITSGKITWHENVIGNGLSWTDRDVTCTFNDARDLELADLDKDGDLEIVSGSRTDGTVVFFENLGGSPLGFLERSIDAPLPRRGGSLPVSFSVGDLDQDGNFDVIAAHQGANAIVWYSNETIHRSGLFPQQIPVDNTALQVREVLGADINGDGNNDLVAASFDENQITWYENTAGDGTAWTKRLVGAATGAHGVTTADFDKDGDLDIASAARTTNEIAWHENLNGLGTSWSKHVISTEPIGIEACFAIDLNQDGAPDLLSASVLDNQVAWYENDCAGNFTRRVISNDSKGARSVHAGDINHDGLIDVVSASSNDDTIAWFRNNGGSPITFTQFVVSTTDSNPFSVFAADFDKDGLLDIASASSGDDLITVYLNNGATPPGFTRLEVSNQADGARSVTACDMDVDGDMDLLSASANDNKISYYENLGGMPLTFATRAVSSSALTPVTVAACDIDKDGRKDVISGSLADNTVAWYRNRGGQFALTTIDLAPSFLDQEETAAILSIDLAHRGRPGDNDVELASIQLLFESANGIPLSEAEANAIIENLFIYGDDGSGTFETESDILLLTIGTLTFPGGFLRALLPDGDSDTQIVAGDPDKRFFVVAELTVEAGIQAVNTVQVTHVTSASSTAEDADNDIPLLLERVEDVTSTKINITGRTFSCRAGNVNGIPGPITDVLFVNGSVGIDNNRRTVAINPATPLEVFIDTPPSSTGGTARYVVYAWDQEPANGLAVDLRRGLGCMALPVPFSAGTPKPVRIANTFGFPFVLGMNDWPTPVAPAPHKLISLPGGLGMEVTLYLQGLIEDFEAPQGFAGVTNGIVLKVQN